MKKYSLSQSSENPSEFVVNKLANGKYELTYNENIETLQTEEDTTNYSYNSFTATTTAGTYEEFVAELIALKYSIADEIALSRKADDDEEKVEYLTYVEKCKAYAKENY